MASQNLMAFYSALFCHPLLFSTALALLALGSNKTVHYTVIAFPVRTCLWIPTCKAGQCCIVCSGFISRLWVLFSCFTREQDSVESGKFGRLRCSHPSVFYKEPLQNKPGFGGTDFHPLDSSVYSLQILLAWFMSLNVMLITISLKSFSHMCRKRLMFPLELLADPFTESIWETI